MLSLGYTSAECVIVETFIALSNLIDSSLAYYLYVLTSFLWSSLTLWNFSVSQQQRIVMSGHSSQTCIALGTVLLHTLPFPFPVSELLAKAGSNFLTLSQPLGVYIVLVSVGLVLAFSEYADWNPSLLLVWGWGYLFSSFSWFVIDLWQHLLQISRWRHCSLLSAA